LISSGNKTVNINQKNGQMRIEIKDDSSKSSSDDESDIEVSDDDEINMGNIFYQRWHLRSRRLCRRWLRWQN